MVIMLKLLILTSAFSGVLQAAKMKLGGVDTSVNCFTISSPMPRLAPVTKMDLIVILHSTCVGFSAKVILLCFYLTRNLCMQSVFVFD